MNVDQVIAVIRAALHADTLTCGQTMAIRGLWSGAKDDVLTFESTYDPAHAHDMAKLRREQLEAEDFRDEEDFYTDDNEYMEIVDEEDFYTDDNEYMEIVDEEEAPRVSAEEWKSRIIASGRITRKEPR